MDALVPVLCLLLGVALTLGTLYLLGRRAWRQLAVADAYRVVAHGLGLSVDTRGVSLHGHLGPRRIYVGEVLLGHGPDRQTEHRGILGLERPLGLGLLVRRKASRWWWRRARASKVRTDEEFDRAFEVFGDDEGRIHDLLTPEVKETIRAFVARWPDLLLTDHHVRVRLERPEDSAAGLQALVAAMQRLADVLLEARQHVAPPEALEPVVEPWRQLADRLGLAFEPWTPAIVGSIDGLAVRVSPRRETEGFAAEIDVDFPPHRALGLRLRPQVEPDGYWSVGQDIQIGDPDFDRAFVVKGFNPRAVGTLLQGPFRDVLLELHGQALDIDADDRELEIRRVPLDAETVERVVRQALAAARSARF